MSVDRLEELELELKDALHAIEILTDRLMNLAVIENRFLSLVDKLGTQYITCNEILCQIEQAEKRIEYLAKIHADEVNDFFTFRFKWIERIIMKRKNHW